MLSLLGRYRATYSCTPWRSHWRQTNTLSKSTVIKVDLQKEHVRKGNWSLRENFYDYSHKKMGNLMRYVDSLSSSEKETATLQKIKTEYSKFTGKPVDIFPFTPSIEQITRTVEDGGDGFLSKEEIQFYIAHGLVGPMPLKSLKPDFLQSIYTQFTGITNTLGSKGYRDVRVRQEWVSLEILELASNVEIVSRVSSLLGENIKIRFTGIHEIPPKTGAFAAATNDKIAAFCAHSDLNLGSRLSKIGLSHSPVDTDSINVWISITGTGPDNAPLFLFPRTHRWPIFTPLKYLDHARENPEQLERTFRLLSIGEFGSEIVANHALFYHYLHHSPLRNELFEIPEIEVYTQPGDCIIFSTHLQHGSEINQTEQPRLGISVRYSRATNKENTDTVRLLRSLFSKEELFRLGIKENDSRAPILQILGRASRGFTTHRSRCFTPDISRKKTASRN